MKQLTSRKDNHFIKIAKHPVTQKYRTSSQFFPKRPHQYSLPSQEFLDSLNQEDLVTEGSNIQQSISKMLKQLSELSEQINSTKKSCRTQESKLDHIQKEKTAVREYYNLQVKEKLNSKIVVDSQNKLLDRFFFLTEKQTSRPSTANRPGTASSRKVCGKLPEETSPKATTQQNLLSKI